jgi:hypothetical protein
LASAARRSAGSARRETECHLCFLSMSLATLAYHVSPIGPKWDPNSD